MGEGAAVEKMHRVGVLCDDPPTISYLYQRLEGLGYKEKRTIEYLLRDVDAAGDFDRYAQGLVTSSVELIVACSNDAAIAAKRATDRIPIVLLYGVVPVEVGIVQSLVRSGNNVTGSVAIPLELASKSVELFKSALPALTKLAVIVDLDKPVARPLLREIRRAAQQLGVAVSVMDVHSESDLERAFSQIERASVDGILADFSAINFFGEIIEHCAKRGLPAMYPVAPAVTNGGLMAYSPRWVPQLERDAVIIDRILKGAHPGDIPIEQPNEYLFSVNLKAARDLGVTFPPAVLLRANRVVE